MGRSNRCLRDAIHVIEYFLSVFSLELILLFLLLGSVVGLLAGLFGVGGGIVTVPVLIFGLPLVGVPVEHAIHMAVGTSLATIVVTSLSSIQAHHSRGGVIWSEFRRLAPGILVGAWLGGVIANMLAGPVLQQIFGVFAVAVGLRMLLLHPADAQSHNVGVWVKRLAGVVIGVISAMVGIGGGALTVPFLHTAGVEMRRAVATSSACGLPIAVAGAGSFMAAGWGVEDLPEGSLGYVYWPVALIVVLTSALLAPMGALWAHRLPGERLRRIFGLFLAVVGIKLLVL
jgi:uncharacterized membrane protein YfcA